MTKEQALAILENLKYELSNQVGSKYCRAKYEAINYVIKALERPTSEDCVSKKEVLKQIKEWRDCEFVKMTNSYHYLEKRIQSIPPVTPTDEIGVWVEERDDYGKVNAWHCSNCYERTGFYTDYASNFCRECGVKKIGIVKSDEEAKMFLEKRGSKVGWSSLENVREKVERGDENG